MRVALFAVLLAVAGASPASDLMKKSAAQPDFLPVDQAFELQPLQTRNGVATVSWRVTPGYYLYRARLGFSAGSPSLKLGAPQYPKGQPHHDELLGDTEIYVSDLAINVPVSGSGILKVTYQGCAEKGLCYPPQTRELTLGSAAAK